MMNTLDLSVDHAFWELDQNPWVVRNLLDNFTRHYSYVDEVQSIPAMRHAAPAGSALRTTWGLTIISPRRATAVTSWRISRGASRT